MAIHEGDLIIPTLRLLSDAKDGFLETSQLIVELTEIFNPTGKDAAIADGRSDTYFSQKVRNMISHRTVRKSFINQGFANYDSKRNGLQITNEGRQFIASFGI